MQIINSFPLKDIIISDDYKEHQPKQKKLDSKQAYYEQFGELPADIIINNDNVLIDGYTTYLKALEYGIESIDISRGYIEVIEAKHRAAGDIYLWRVPAKLTGKLEIGRKCLVRTSKGVRRVRIVSIMQQQYPQQEPYMKSVLSAV